MFFSVLFQYNCSYRQWCFQRQDCARILHKWIIRGCIGTICHFRDTVCSCHGRYSMISLSHVDTHVGDKARRTVSCVCRYHGTMGRLVDPWPGQWLPVISPTNEMSVHGPSCPCRGRNSRTCTRPSWLWLAYWSSHLWLLRTVTYKTTSHLLEYSNTEISLLALVCLRLIRTSGFDFYI